jgi:two-component system phosphate regulon sensor histidine kinase PhoR
MVKNPTPQQIALLAGALILLVAFGSLLLFDEFPQLATLGGYLLWAPVFFFLVYHLVSFLLRQYIYRKIKLIYKTIRQEKLAPHEKQDRIDIKRNVIEEAEREVADWAERQRTELDKYKSWAEYRRHFLGDISHELKTPLFNIQGYLDSLLEGGVHDPKVNVAFLQRASKNVDRLQTIIMDLETIARLESGQLILEIQTFDVKELAREVIEEMEGRANEKNISLEFKDKASANVKVRADREKVRQVFINLIQNSIKYGVQNGRTRVGFYDMDRMVLVEVADNGIGIPREHLNHIFDRFYRVDKSRSREQGGSGLGLSIVKHIIEAHKQTINVRSTPNFGSTFGFTLEKV